MHWFKPVGILFVPISLVGWLITALGVAFCAQLFVFVDSHSHSVSDTFYRLFPFWVPTFLAIAWLADRTGGRARSS